MNTLSIDKMQWNGGNTASGAIACGAAALGVVIGIVAVGWTGGSAGTFLAAFICDNVAMAITCINAAD